MRQSHFLSLIFSPLPPLPTLPTLHVCVCKYVLTTMVSSRCIALGSHVSQTLPLGVRGVRTHLTVSRISGGAEMLNMSPWDLMYPKPFPGGFGGFILI